MLKTIKETMREIMLKKKMELPKTNETSEMKISLGSI